MPADLDQGGGHALNAEAAGLLAGGARWTGRDLRDRMLVRGVAQDAADEMARRFMGQLRSLGVIAAGDG